MFHFGVVKALLDAKLLPRVVSGSSAGSIGGCAAPAVQPTHPPPARRPTFLQGSAPL
jgi:predicted acylesterase/phospholipase RssA